ncbi:helix-turn-helix domain-containing protein [Alkalibacterium sp. MB6]|uniref:helix-turn-helix domain-containing protein n=1 Tax=Alkalibacterium sp. MB6 TaxID=2081965 RepID=UPI001379E9C3|nr:helix-turn-helix domain-containing protein [Alkalibacterium sp. MB6]
MFSERLKASRKEVGLTQVELAKTLKVSSGTVGMWETGKREPKFEVMGHLSKRLNKSVDYLLGLSENASPQAADKTHLKESSRLQARAEVIYSCDDYDLVLIKKT